MKNKKIKSMMRKIIIIMKIKMITMMTQMMIIMMIKMMIMMMDQMRTTIVSSIENNNINKGVIMVNQNHKIQRKMVVEQLQPIERPQLHLLVVLLVMVLQDTLLIVLLNQVTSIMAMVEDHQAIDQLLRGLTHEVVNLAH